MRQGVKAFLLSALVFPGLGQLYNQDRRKGIFLVLSANLLFAILLLVGMVLLSQGYYELFYPKPLTGAVLRELLGYILTRPLFLAPFCLLVGLWAYGAVDAARSPGRHPPEGQ
jgi:O-antigen/teichoic acid export membrane protein